MRWVRSRASPPWRVPLKISQSTPAAAITGFEKRKAHQLTARVRPRGTTSSFAHLHVFLEEDDAGVIVFIAWALRTVDNELARPLRDLHSALGHPAHSLFVLLLNTLALTSVVPPKIGQCRGCDQEDRPVARRQTWLPSQHALRDSKEAERSQGCRDFSRGWLSQLGLYRFARTCADLDWRYGGRGRLRRGALCMVAPCRASGERPECETGTRR